MSRLPSAAQGSEYCDTAIVGPSCPTCGRRWVSLRPDGASLVGNSWIEIRTCQKHQYSVSKEVSRNAGIRACEIAIQYIIDFTPNRVAEVVPRLVTILGREAMR